MEVICFHCDGLEITDKFSGLGLSLLYRNILQITESACLPTWSR